jgi:hypothetical protein
LTRRPQAGQSSAEEDGNARLFGLYRLISIPRTAGVHDTRTGVVRILIQATPCPETLGHAAYRTHSRRSCRHGRASSRTVPRQARRGVHDHCVTNDVDTLATALNVRTDDLLKRYPDLAPWRSAIGLQARLTDPELVTLAATPPMPAGSATPGPTWSTYSLCDVDRKAGDPACRGSCAQGAVGRQASRPRRPCRYC